MKKQKNKIVWLSLIPFEFRKLNIAVRAVEVGNILQIQFYAEKQSQWIDMFQFRAPEKKKTILTKK